LPRKIWPIALVALAAIAAFPSYMNHRVTEARAGDVATPAPVDRDYERRDALVAFWEGAVRENHAGDMLSPRQLAGQYLQRYREKGDIGDVVRAASMARRSLAAQPRNIAATAELASVFLTLHRFREALHEVEQNVPYDPAGAQFRSQEASLLMELGNYEAARNALAHIGPAEAQTVGARTVRSRYDELTGHLAAARRLLDSAMTEFDSDAEASAQARAWYHFRAGELAFAAGDNDAAIEDERDALALFPTYNLALKDLAKFELANHHYREALDAATAGARVTPFPETLGYEADAQAALGDARGAAATRDLIFAIERIGNAYGVNDRLLAIYYSEHGLRPADTLQIARREVALRGNEIYAQDTLAWAAAAAGRWNIAKRASSAALRFKTEDPLLWFHAGMIARHFGDEETARQDLLYALALNPHFHAVYADVARRALQQSARAAAEPPKIGRRAPA
jgi:predicted Zn-dependent protease